MSWVAPFYTTHHVKYQRLTFLQQQNAVNQDLFYALTVTKSNNGFFEKRNALFSTKISKKNMQFSVESSNAANLEKRRIKLHECARLTKVLELAFLTESS